MSAMDAPSSMDANPAGVTCLGSSSRSSARRRPEHGQQERAELVEQPRLLRVLCRRPHPRHPWSLGGRWVLGRRRSAHAGMGFLASRRRFVAAFLVERQPWREGSGQPQLASLMLGG
jgi:hypothetical protein